MLINLIEVKDLTKTYKMGDIEVHALQSINLSIQKGEFVSIMGMSGSGKTTLMNILGCLDKPTSGSYRLDNVMIEDIPKDDLADIRNQKIGFVFQSFYLLSRTSALENVELPLLYRKSLKRKERISMAEDALKTVQMSERLHHYPNQLSGGQQQRVAIARAIVNNPVILFADEPTGNLDSRTSLEIINVFQELHKKGITIIIVTHEPEIAQFTERIVTFSDGKIINDVKNHKIESAMEVLKQLSHAKKEEN
ncbi:ABC transporter ATP-binding protein [bacterium]|nr:ABC transporter ATP-binding protein [bacterium]